MKRISEAMELPGRGYGRVIDVIELLAGNSAGLTGSEIHRALGLPKSTVFLLLKHLSARGIVQADEASGRFVVGHTLLQIAHQVTGGFALIREARGFLEDLSRRTTEDVYLAVRNGAHLIYVDKIVGTRSIGFDVRLGLPRYLHSTASGKVLLAFDRETLLDEVVKQVGLPALTPATISEVNELRKELRRIRAAGYALSDGQNVEGVFGMAAPLLGFSGTVEAVVHLSVLSDRARRERKMLLDELLKTTEAIASAVGWKRRIAPSRVA
jgi:IclR family KDG regulon transcriptional repressor